MIYDQDPFRRRPRKSAERCVEMVEYFAKWRSELDQPAKVAASEGYEGYGVPMAVDR